jgi:steroid 5-alpha reductase family enzyme
MALILGFTLPVLRSMGGGPLSWIDYGLALVFVGLVIVETVADQQQWDFHKEKKRLAGLGQPLPDPYEKGFVHTGLWRMVRHPNYAAEQAIWIVFYFFSVAATGMPLNWSVTGALLLVLLFKGSTDFSESISAGKYPEYAMYQKSAPRFIPIRLRRKPSTEETLTVKNA